MNNKKIFFWCVSFLLSVVQLLLFGRAADHEFFVNIILNNSQDVSRISDLIQYGYTTFYLPISSLSSNELLWIIYLRLMYLVAVYLLFFKVTRGAPEWLFLCLITLYPSALVQSLNLTRDGCAVVLIMYSLIFHFRGRFFLSASFSLWAGLIRPEALIIFLLYIACSVIFKKAPALLMFAKYRFVLLLFCFLVYLFVLTVSTEYRTSVFEFSDMVFEDYQIYPENHFSKLIQGFFDPYNIASLATPTIYEASECIFFISLIALIFMKLPKFSIGQLSLVYSGSAFLVAMLCLEYYVGAYSRHRTIGALFLLLSCISNLNAPGVHRCQS